MLESMFRGLFGSDLTAVISVPDFLLCLGTALVLGLLMAFAYLFRARYTKSFVVTLALLPAAQAKALQSPRPLRQKPVLRRRRTQTCLPIGTLRQHTTRVSA